LFVPRSAPVTKNVCISNRSRRSGRRIVAILGRAAGDLTDEDYAHMRKVVGFVRRHGAQRPENIYTSRWRYSLMNWGHDPTREA